MSDEQWQMKKEPIASRLFFFKFLACIHGYTLRGNGFPIIQLAFAFSFGMRREGSRLCVREIGLIFSCFGQFSYFSIRRSSVEKAISRKS